MNITPDGTTSPTADLDDLATLWRVYNAAKAAYESAPDPDRS